MATRRIEAPTLLEAVRRARLSAGPEAVVVSARLVPASRWPFGRRRAFVRIEVEAPGVSTERPSPAPGEAALLEQIARLADQMAELRSAVEALRTSGGEARTPSSALRPIRSVRNRNATAGSVDPWSRESSSS
jgi:hypothetical protein